MAETLGTTRSRCAGCGHGPDIGRSSPGSGPGSTLTHVVASGGFPTPPLLPLLLTPAVGVFQHSLCDWPAAKTEGQREAECECECECTHGRGESDLHDLLGDS